MVNIPVVQSKHDVPRHNHFRNFFVRSWFYGMSETQRRYRKLAMQLNGINTRLTFIDISHNKVREAISTLIAFREELKAITEPANVNFFAEYPELYEEEEIPF